MGKLWTGIFWGVIFSLILWAILAFLAYGLYLIGGKL